MVLEYLSFDAFVAWFQNIGGFTVILPFLLIFTIVFALFEKLELFGPDKKNIHALLGVVFGFLLISQQNIVAIINRFLPNVSLFIIVFLMLLLVMGMFVEKEKLKSGPRLLIFVVALVSIIWALSDSFGYNWFGVYLTPQDIANLIILGVIILVIRFVIKKDEDGPSRSNSTRRRRRNWGI